MRRCFWQSALLAMLNKTLKMWRDVIPYQYSDAAPGPDPFTAGKKLANQVTRRAVGENACVTFRVTVPYS